MDIFLPEYLKALSGKFQNLFKPEIFKRSLLEATEMMIKSNDKNKTNKEIFMEEFFARIDRPDQEIMPMIDEFYQKDYPYLKKCLPSPGRGREMVEKALDMGLNIVLATNPVFPKEAVIERLRWGGLENYPFVLITSYENMHFCKPNPAYYEEILEKISAEPDECLMVGNDCLEDMVAKKAGIDTFLLTDFKIEKEKGIQPSFEGNTDDFLKWLDGLK